MTRKMRSSYFIIWRQNPTFGLIISRLLCTKNIRVRFEMLVTFLDDLLDYVSITYALNFVTVKNITNVFRRTKHQVHRHAFHLKNYTKNIWKHTAYTIDGCHKFPVEKTDVKSWKNGRKERRKKTRGCATIIINLN